MVNTRTTLEPLVSQSFLAGIVALVGNREGVVGIETFGHADVAAGKPMRDDTMFWIASQTKPMTASAVMMLVEAGKVALDDPVEKYVQAFTGLWVTVERDAEHVLLRRPARAVTVRDLLRHTAGLPARSTLETPTRDRFSLQDLVRAHVLTPLLYEPGTKYLYSNTGIAVAGRLIEIVSGMPYATFMQKRLFDPLGMTDTTFWPNDEQIGRLAHTYKTRENKPGLELSDIELLREPYSDKTRHPFPGGGLFSTARDVERFCRMFLRGGELDGRRYLAEASVREMTTRQTGPDIPESYGLGWEISDDTFNHGGAYGTHMAVDPTRGLTVIYLIQHRGPMGDLGPGHKLLLHAARQPAP